MKRNFDWEDLKLFLAVAKAGGLAGASDRTGVSAATLGRRVAALEKSLNLRLVERGARGYDLTSAGRDLVRRAETMDQAAQEITGWTESGASRQRVRISAGEWTMRLLIDHIKVFWTEQSDWFPEFLTDLRHRDVARRQIDIGVRNSRPKQPWLAGKKVGIVEYAAYQSRNVGPERDLGWIGLVEDGAQSRTGQWLQEKHGSQATITLNKAPLALSIVRQGNARMLLPLFVGEAYEDLQRISEPVSDLQTDRWLVMHHEQRNDPAIRQAIKGLSALLKTSPKLRSDCT